MLLVSFVARGKECAFLMSTGHSQGHGSVRDENDAVSVLGALEMRPGCVVPVHTPCYCWLVGSCPASTWACKLLSPLQVLDKFRGPDFITWGGIYGLLQFYGHLWNNPELRVNFSAPSNWYSNPRSSIFQK